MQAELIAGRRWTSLPSLCKSIPFVSCACFQSLWLSDLRSIPEVLTSFLLLQSMLPGPTVQAYVLLFQLLLPQPKARGHSCASEISCVYFVFATWHKFADRPASRAVFSVRQFSLAVCNLF